ncbi:MAG: hypothetical protein A2287_03090 [Candidatus Melainabacteria bacterium RIFOXYA12_FULL_32_12]|nr:MAG: hypothetical protein A2287_03090 [Candidatus Melainabacteria bacterium RIFOXYA12_FULL_32_12]
MIELLILTILLDNKSSIYGIKQKIENKFSAFFKISFGSIYPALKKLEKNKYVTVKTQLSPGGQKKSTYSITNEGKEYFQVLMLEVLPENPALASQLINIKLIALPKIEVTLQQQATNTIIEHLEHNKANIEILLNNPENNKDKFQKKFLEYNLIKTLEDIKWISSLTS